MKNKTTIFGFMAGVVVAGLVIVSVINFIYRSDYLTGSVIAEDVKKLEAIFVKIHKDCIILSFDYQQNPINFLNVEKFTGSEVGSMNLARPENWKGPYVDDNPTVQGKEYMVVRTKQGHFITPGNGVKLPSGRTIGKDLVLNEDADIDYMMRRRSELYFKGRQLAQRMISFRPPVEYPLAWKLES